MKLRPNKNSGIFSFCQRLRLFGECEYGTRSVTMTKRLRLLRTICVLTCCFSSLCWVVLDLKERWDGNSLPTGKCVETHHADCLSNSSLFSFWTLAVATETVLKVVSAFMWLCSILIWARKLELESPKNNKKFERRLERQPLVKRKKKVWNMRWGLAATNRANWTTESSPTNLPSPVFSLLLIKCPGSVSTSSSDRKDQKKPQFGIQQQPAMER